jgi:hypothetical protein
VAPRPPRAHLRASQPSDIRQGITFLRQEIQRYNFRQVHFTTLEVPFFRLQKALKEKRTLFRQFKIKPPYKSALGRIAPSMLTAAFL